MTVRELMASRQMCAAKTVIVFGSSKKAKKPKKIDLGGIQVYRQFGAALVRALNKE